MTQSQIYQDLSSLPGVRGVVHCSPDGEVVYRHGDALDSLGQALPEVVRLAALLGADLSLGTLREAELHGARHAVCVPCSEGVFGVETLSRATISDVSGRLHAVLA